MEPVCPFNCERVRFYGCMEVRGWSALEPARPGCLHLSDSVRAVRRSVLVLVPPEECPQSPAGGDTLPRCNVGGSGFGLRLGEICEGDGECNTDRLANNCGPFDVYRHVTCFPTDSMSMRMLSDASLAQSGGP